MLPHNNFDVVRKIGKRIHNEGAIGVSEKLLRVNFRNTLFDYTDDQLSSITDVGFDIYNEEQQTLIGKPLVCGHQLVTARDIFLNHDNKFIGWNCYGGIESFFINELGDVFVGQCQRGALGNIIDGITLPDIPFVCDKRSCNCTTDLESCTKENILINS